MAQRIRNIMLPTLRADLRMYQAPDDQDGSPTYNLHDPVRSQYFRITWPESCILKYCKKGMTLFDLMHLLYTKTTLRVSPEEVLAFFEDATKNGLLETPKSSIELMAEIHRQRMQPIKWLLLHYLYMRFPIVYPNQFLTKTLQYVKPLLSPLAIALYLVLSIAGLSFVFMNSAEYFGTFTYFFNFWGIVSYIAAVFCVKVIHELSHAYVAKYYGLHVPVIGIAFIVLWPVLFTDVTDSWKLKSRGQRLAVTVAGVTAELLLAGLATIGWALSDPGFMQSIFFIVSSSTWISSLLININPFMRFDGYYLLSDLWGIDNLQPRSFAMLRWQFIQTCFGLDLTCPEERLSVAHQRSMVVYALLTWTYRVFLYTAIAVFIYFHVGKALGMFLFLVEVGIFILFPLIEEAIFIYRLRARLTMNKRSVTTLALLVIGAIWFIFPLPHAQGFSAIVIPDALQQVHVLNNGVVMAEYVKKGDDVHVGQPLALIYSEKLYNATEQLQVQRDLVVSQIISFSSEEAKHRDEIGEKLAELATIDAKLQAAEGQKRDNLLVSSIDGQVFDWDKNLVHRFVKKDAIIGRIASPNTHWEVLVYIPEEYIFSIRKGDTVKFVTKNGAWRLHGEVTSISPSRVLDTPYLQLTSLEKGPLPAVAVKTTGAARLLESYYEVRVKLTDDKELGALKMGQTGTAVFRSHWYSMCFSLFKKMSATAWQESTF